jgi:hypothetical protein
MPSKNNLARALLTLSLIVALLGFLTMDAAALLYLFGYDSEAWFFFGFAATTLGCLLGGLIGSLFLERQS